MLNEAVFRSPKWLRKFIDFEVATGDDISDRADKKEAQRKRLLAWDRAWREMVENNEDEFCDFLKEVYKNYVKQNFNNWVFASDLPKVKKEFRGDMEIWKKFEQWKNKKSEKQKIKSELEELYNKLQSDFFSAPYNDKIETPREGGKVCFKYRFENGHTFKICGDKVQYTDDKYIRTYTISLIFRAKFVNLCNLISSNSRTRPSSGSSSSGGYKSGGSKRKYDDPNKDRYEKLKDTIRLREEQLKKMSNSDPDRKPLENELDNYKRALKRMKDKYKFEHVVSYFDFK